MFSEAMTVSQLQDILAKFDPNAIVEVFDYEDNLNDIKYVYFDCRENCLVLMTMDTGIDKLDVYI